LVFLVKCAGVRPEVSHPFPSSNAILANTTRPKRGLPTSEAGTGVFQKRNERAPLLVHPMLMLSTRFRNRSSARELGAA